MFLSNVLPPSSPVYYVINIDTSCLMQIILSTTETLSSARRHTLSASPPSRAIRCTGVASRVTPTATTMTHTMRVTVMAMCMTAATVVSEVAKEVSTMVATVIMLITTASLCQETVMRATTAHIVTHLLRLPSNDRLVRLLG